MAKLRSGNETNDRKSDESNSVEDSDSDSDSKTDDEDERGNMNSSEMTSDSVQQDDDEDDDDEDDSDEGDDDDSFRGNNVSSRSGKVSSGGRTGAGSMLGLAAGAMFIINTINTSRVESICGSIQLEDRWIPPYIPPYNTTI